MQRTRNGFNLLYSIVASFSAVESADGCPKQASEHQWWQARHFGCENTPVSRGSFSRSEVVSRLASASLRWKFVAIQRTVLNVESSIFVGFGVIAEIPTQWTTRKPHK